MVVKLTNMLVVTKINVDAIASQDPAVVEAKKHSTLLKVDHLYGEREAAWKRIERCSCAVRNGKIKSQRTYNTADKAQGSYYILNETPEQRG